MELAKTLAQEPPEEFVPVHGEVHLATDFGVFLNVQGRRFFVPESCLQMLDRVPLPGEAVTLNISRPYAKQQGLAAGLKTRAVGVTQK